MMPKYKKTELHQGRAPIAEAMEAYARDGALAFHTPGHKQGLGAHPLLKKLITTEGLKEEVSLMEELDDLHEPTMCIKDAQKLAADLYAADTAYFMINGTTGAIHTMLLGALKPGDTVLLPRNAHRSMIGGLILAGAKPVFINPAIDDKLGIAMGLRYADIAAAIKKHPEAKALALVYPTYYGVTIDLTKVAKLVHAHDMLLLVDEAHGSHLKFSDKLPKQAIDCGADMAAQSTHKITGAMTQCSLLLVNNKRIAKEKVRQAASLLQSTSPNQLLLASLDIARLQLAEQGRLLVGRAVELAQKLRADINKIAGLWSFGCDYLNDEGASGLDVTKVTVNVRGLGISGPQAESILRHEYKIQCELSDAYNVLFIISYADTERETGMLLQALQNLAAKVKQKTLFTVQNKLPELPQTAMSPRAAFFAPAENINFADALGRIAAEQVMFYPPGIPILLPGDLIAESALAYIREMQALGLKVVGPEDAALKKLKVVKIDD